MTSDFWRCPHNSISFTYTYADVHWSLTAISRDGPAICAPTLLLAQPEFPSPLAPSCRCPWYYGLVSKVHWWNFKLILQKKRKVKGARTNSPDIMFETKGKTCVLLLAEVILPGKFLTPNLWPFKNLLSPRSVRRCRIPVLLLLVLLMLLMLLVLLMLLLLLSRVINVISFITFLRGYIYLSIYICSI